VHGASAVRRPSDGDHVLRIARPAGNPRARRVWSEVSTGPEKNVGVVRLSIKAQALSRRLERPADHTHRHNGPATDDT